MVDIITENNEKADKSKNIVIYGLEFGKDNHIQTIKEFLNLLQIDFEKFGKVKVEVRRRQNKPRSVCMLQFEALKFKKRNLS